MIKLFRNIRKQLLAEGKTTKYLKYAMGEIILVVIGILIALQINNWNENRKNKVERVAILKNLKTELAEDLSILTYTLDRLDARKKAADYLYKLITSETKSMALDSSQIVDALMRCGYIHKFVPTLAVYNEIQNSGKLNLIQSDGVKKLLASYKSTVEENIRIEAPYEIALKNFEKDAVYYLSEIPFSNKKFTESYKLINFDLLKISKNEAFLTSLKHISYITRIEIVLKGEFLSTVLRDLEDLIDKKLMP
jgi:ribosomal protein L17